MLVDIHCHLEREPINARTAAVVQAARDARLGLIITAGTTPSGNDAALALATDYAELVKPSFGMYPLEAVGLDVLPNDTIVKIEPFDVDAELDRWRARRNDFVAVGEVGLDYKWTKDEPTMAAQKAVFAKAIAIAEELRKPIIVHSRSAEADCIEMLESSSCKAVVMHCFGGRKQLIRRGVDAGFFFSVPPVIAKLQHFQTLVDMVPVEQLLTETDSPWLGPEGGLTNEPKNVAVSLAAIARQKKIAESEAEAIIWTSARSIFG